MGLLSDFGGASGLAGLIGCSLLSTLATWGSVSGDPTETLTFVVIGLAATCSIHLGSALLSPVVSPMLYGAFDAEGRRNWHGRVVGTCFAFFSLSLAIAERLDPSPELEADHFFGSSARSRLLLGVTHGFFTWDAAFSFCMTKQEAAVRGHALSGIVVGVANLQPFCQRQIAAILVWEASTPLLNLRTHLKECGLTSGSLFMVVNVLFAVTFLGVRWGIGLRDSLLFIPEAWALFRAGDPRLRYCALVLAFVGNLMMNSFNLLWGTLVLKGVLKTVGLLKSSRGKKA